MTFGWLLRNLAGPSDSGRKKAYEKVLRQEEFVYLRDITETVAEQTEGYSCPVRLEWWLGLG